MILPLHSYLSNRARPHLKEKKKKREGDLLAHVTKTYMEKQVAAEMGPRIDWNGVPALPPLFSLPSSCHLYCTGWTHGCSRLTSPGFDTKGQPRHLVAGLELSLREGL